MHGYLLGNQNAADFWEMMVGVLLQKFGWGGLWVVLGLRELLKIGIRGREVLVIPE